MRKLGLAIVVVALWSAPRAASAGPFVEGSLGLGWHVSPSLPAGAESRQPLNIMIAPGYGFLADLLKVSVGFAGSGFGDVSGDVFRLQIRPMVTVQPPLFPLYVRGMLAFLDVTHSDTSQTAFGAAAGLSFGLLGVGVFGEVGALTFSAGGSQNWIVEGRAGVSIGF